MIRLPPSSTLFPYTTFFRTQGIVAVGHGHPPPDPIPPAFRPAGVPGGAEAVRHGAERGSRGAGGLDAALPMPLHGRGVASRSEEHTVEVQHRQYLVCRLLL